MVLILTTPLKISSKCAVAGARRACVAAGDDAFSCSRAHRQPSRRGSRADFYHGRRAGPAAVRAGLPTLAPNPPPGRLRRAPGASPRHLRRLAKPRDDAGGMVHASRTSSRRLAHRRVGQSPRKAAHARRLRLLGGEPQRRHFGAQEEPKARAREDGRAPSRRPPPAHTTAPARGRRARARQTRERNAFHSGGERGRRGKPRTRGSARRRGRRRDRSVRRLRRPPPVRRLER